MPSNSSTKDPVRVAAGYKAALAREEVSDEAKARAQERLEEMGAMSTEADDEYTPDETHSTNKATSNKEKHAREILEAAGYTVTEKGHEDKNQERVLAGYKAALHNPRVSDEAKAHAREYLEEHDAL
ncbi:Conidiation protein 6-domain-containing protein [Mycena capillaripes]|nr:Conidiation protein 6-domain-containing protein [Mycena capillaripes]